MSDKIIWKDIPSAPGYAASCDGQIKRTLLCPGTQGRILRQSGSPYLAVAISINGKEKTRRVHALVCEAFHGPAPQGCEVRHLDGDRANNHADNLSWGTRKQNHADKRAHGTAPWGENAYQAKLTEQEVREVRRRFVAGESFRVLSAVFGVSRSTIGDVISGRTWRHI